MWIVFIISAVLGATLFLSRREAIGLLFIMALATSGFQIIPSEWFKSPIFFAKPYDYAYLSTAIILTFRVNRITEILRVFSIARDAVLYCLLIGLISLVSLLLFSYNVVQVVQSARLFIWPIFLILFLCADYSSLRRVSEILFPIVLITSLLYIQQLFTGLVVFSVSGDEAPRYLEGSNLLRFLATPDFLIFFLLMASSNIQRGRLPAYTGSLGNWFMLIATLVVQFASFTRSALVATVLALSHILLGGKSRVLATFASISLFAVVAIVISLNPTMAQRFGDGVEDITSTLEGGFIVNDGRFDGNLAFRIGHLHERASYILEDPARWPIGIGMIHEESEAAANLGFRVGLLSVERGGVVQVDTGDIAWSILIVKTGVIGVIALLYFLYRSYRYAGSINSSESAVFQGACLYFIITSIFGNSFASPSLMMQLMFFLALALRSKYEINLDK